MRACGEGYPTFLRVALGRATALRRVSDWGKHAPSVLGDLSVA